MKAGTDYIGVGVGGLIVNDKNQVLLLKRSQNCKNEVGYWSRTGGTVEFMEKVEDALKRETREEIGVEIEIIRSLGYVDHFPEDVEQHWVSMSFIAKITSGEIRNLEPHKCDEIRWFDLDDLPELMPQYVKDSIESFREMINGHLTSR